jgi:signal transduction histidine kinase
MLDHIRIDKTVYPLPESFLYNEKSFRLLVHTIPNSACVVFDHDLRYLFADGQGFMETGRDVNDIIGSTLMEIYPPEICAKVVPDFKANLHGKKTHSEVEYAGRIYLLHGAPVYNQSEQIIAGLCIIQNNTRRKRIEAQMLARSQEVIALQKITSALAVQMRSDEVMLSLRQQLANSMGLSAGAVFLFCDKEKKLSMPICWGLPLRIKKTFEDDLISCCMDQPILPIQNPTRYLPCRRLRPNAPACEHTSCKWQHCLSVPIKMNENVLGVILLYSDSQKTFAPERMNWFATLGLQVGGALERAHLFEELLKREEAYRDLSRKYVNAQEMERSRLARELHDEIGQELTGLKCSIELAKMPDTQPAEDKLNASLDIVHELISSVRELSLQLRPPMLEEYGLASTLEWFFDRLQRRSGFHVNHAWNMGDDRLPLETELTLFRFIQEGLTNVMRHSGAMSASVTIGKSQEKIRVMVQDAGKGFDPSKIWNVTDKSGLIGMKERFHLLDGEIYVQAGAGRGVTLIGELPIE